MPTGDVVFVINDGGAVVIPGTTVQVVIGTSSIGTVAQIFATQSPSALVAQFGYGPLVEAATLACLAGGTVIAMRATSNTAGASAAVTTTAGGTSVITATGTPNDSYQVKILFSVGATVGVAGAVFKISLDAGRNYGPSIALGTANTYVIPQTGITLNFAAGTILANQSSQFATSEPLWNTTGIQACLNTLVASSYVNAGWGSMHIVGGSTATNFSVGVPGSDASTLQTYMDTLATGKVFSRAILSARDVKLPVAWGGIAETEAAWLTTVTADYSAVSAKRICATAGHYNMPSGVANTTVGAPRYRRPLAWALAARQVQIPAQRHAGRVRDGSLSNVIVDSTNDPTDGFVYHDERIISGFDVARFTSARTRVGIPGVFINNPNLMSPAGSVFSLLPLGNVMDVACNLVNQVGQSVINSDVRVNSTGTIYELEARTIEADIRGAISSGMIAKSMISAATVAVDRTANISVTSIVPVNVSLLARGYVLEEDVTIGFVNTAQAGS